MEVLVHVDINQHDRKCYWMVNHNSGLHRTFHVTNDYTDSDITRWSVYYLDGSCDSIVASHIGFRYSKNIVRW